MKQTKSLTDGREIRLEAADGLPGVSADSALIQMVISHLIENAVKYTPPGSPIAIGAGVQQNSVVFRVTDQGPGITPDEQSRIFDKFYRGSKGQHLKGNRHGAGHRP